MSKEDDREIEALKKQIRDFKPVSISQVLLKAARAQIQRELAAVRTIQSQYERYCEEERAADRMPKEFDEWQREFMRKTFCTT